MVTRALAALALACAAACATAPGIDRTAYRVPLEANPRAAEARACVRTCRTPRISPTSQPELMGHHHLHASDAGFFACLDRCPGMRQHAGACLPVDRPPAALCFERITEATRASGTGGLAGALGNFTPFLVPFK